MPVSAVNKIRGNHLIAGASSGFRDCAAAARGVPQRADKFLFREQSLATPRRVDIEAVRLLAPHMCREAAWEFRIMRIARIARIARIHGGKISAFASAERAQKPVALRKWQTSVFEFRFEGLHEHGGRKMLP